MRTERDARQDDPSATLRGSRRGPRPVLGPHEAWLRLSCSLLLGLALGGLLLLPGGCLRHDPPELHLTILDGGTPDEGPPPDQGEGDLGPPADLGACGAQPFVDCSWARGVCRTAVARCVPGRGWVCEPGAPVPFEPGGETLCDGLDNDCDGEVDEGHDVGAQCRVPGACGVGELTCKSDGSAAVCTGVVAADEEVCNGLDDDCDGATDEDPPPPAELSCLTQGVCQGTVPTCQGEAGWQCVYPATHGPGETACDGLDNDCDGETDEEYPVVPACGQGACRERSTPSRCVAGVETPCQPAAPLGATDATCDRVDDDCDGRTDEDYTSEVMCGVGSCRRVTLCRDGVPVCTPGPPGEEICDDRDNDCDAETDEGCDGCPEELVIPEGWVCVPAGTFWMGSPEEEDGRYQSEARHSVILSHALLVQRTEVTQGEWATALGGARPSRFSACGVDCPVEGVRWFEALADCNARSLAEGLTPCYADPDDSGDPYDLADAEAQKVPLWSEGLRCEGYRLPTEAEWEHATRARDLRATYAGDLDPAHLGCEPGLGVLEEIGWYCGNSAVAYAGCQQDLRAGSPGCAGTPPVAGAAPNTWGLHDVLGNVWEWCWDWFDDLPAEAATDPAGPDAGEARVIRGGSWINAARDLRAASRQGDWPEDRSSTIGLRPVRTIP